MSSCRRALAPGVWMCRRHGGWWRTPLRGCGNVVFTFAFVGDELVEPAHFAFNRLKTVLLQFEGVAIEAFAGSSRASP